PTLFYVALAAVLVWLGFRPLQVTLAWAWDGYSRLRELSEQLRQHQAELAEALRGLNLAYERLERTSEELARARAAADGARRLKAEFAAKISHELRTPLNLVIGFSEMLMTAPRPDDPRGSAHPDEAPLPGIYRDDVEAIYRNAQHLSTLIDDVLELGEI